MSARFLKLGWDGVKDHKRGKIAPKLPLDSHLYSEKFKMNEEVDSLLSEKVSKDLEPL